MAGRDVFICHAHLDKSAYVRPLSEILNRRGISCWLDEAQILPGESLVEKINEGLRSSRIVMVIITDAFINRNWPQKELNSALSREIRTGEVLVVPVLCIDHTTYFGRYPLLEDKLYLDWREGPEALANHIAAFFPRTPALEWHHRHAADHVGLVWIRLLPQSNHIDVTHRLTLRWGPHLKTVELTPRDELPISLMHHKTNQDSIVLHVSVEPPSIITFGQGAPPDEQFHNIDEGWTHSAGGHWPGHL